MARRLIAIAAMAMAATAAAGYVQQKFPYAAVHYVEPTGYTTENYRIGWYVTDFDHSLWRSGDGSKRFDVFVKWSRDDVNWSTLSELDVPSRDGEFDLGRLPAGEYSVAVWCRDRESGLESHRVWQEFRVVEPGALDIPEAKIRRMTAADLAAYGLRNDGDYEHVVMIPSFDPTTINGGQFNVKQTELREAYLQVIDDYLAAHPHQDPGGVPGYTVYVASFKDKPAFRSFNTKRMYYHAGYDRDAVAAIAATNSVGLQRFVDEAAAAGCRKVVLHPGTYRVSHLHTLRVPDGMTLDLGGATLKLDGCNVHGAMMVQLSGVRDAGVCNGTLEGDYYEHDHSLGDCEHVNGLLVDGASSYVTVSNVTVSLITGYGTSNSSGSAGPGTDKVISLTGALSGFVYDGSTGLWRSPAIDISGFAPYHYFAIGNIYGYRNFPTREWNYLCDFLDADGNFIVRENGAQSRLTRIPANAKYARFHIQVANEDEALGNNLYVYYCRSPRNCVFVNNVYDRCRCCGHAASAMRNLLFKGNEYRFTGEAQTVCGFDAEDGWDDMQDPTFLDNWFHDNFRVDLKACAGQNFRYIGNRTSIDSVARSYSPYAVSNSFNNASFGCTWHNRTGFARYFDNTYTGSLVLGGTSTDYGWDAVIHDVTFDASKPGCPVKIVGGVSGRFRDCSFVGIEAVQVPVAENCSFRNCSTGLMRWFYSGDWTSCVATNFLFGDLQFCTNRFIDCTILNSRVHSCLESSLTFIHCSINGLTVDKGATDKVHYLDALPDEPPSVEPEKPDPVPVTITVGPGGDAADIGPALALATNELNVIELAAGTYYVTNGSPITVDRAVTIRPANGAEVVFQGNRSSRIFNLNHRNARLEGLVIRRGGFGSNTAYNALGVYIQNGTMSRCLVTDCRRTSFIDRQPSVGAVYLERGLIERCTIAGNFTTQGPALYVADRPNCYVRDTICWANEARYYTSALGPNVNAPYLDSDREGLWTSNPSFVNASAGDYHLSPASPCRGAGKDGRDLGCYDYVPSDSIGISVSESKGSGSLVAHVALVADGAVELAGATVVWKLNGAAIPETGTSFDYTFTPGVWSVAVEVTPRGGSKLTFELPDAIEVAYAGEVAVSDSETLNRVLAHPSAGLVVRLAEGAYELTREYSLTEPIAIIGTGARENTVITRTPSPSGRAFYLDSKELLIANVTISGGTAAREGGGLWIAGAGGTVSNCVISANRSGVNAGGGGIYMTSADALVTHCLVTNNVAGGSAPGGGVLIVKGTLAKSTVSGNTMQYSDRQDSRGGGVAMTAAGGDAHVLDCTITRNRDNAGAGLYRVAKAGTVERTIIRDNIKSGDGEYTAGPFEGEGFIDCNTDAVYTSLSEALDALAAGHACAMLAGGTYEISSEIVLDRAAALMAAPGEEVVIDAGYRCRCLRLDHADAAADGIRFRRGRVNGNGAGVLFGTNGGTLRNCTVEACQASGSGKYGSGIYMNSAAALVGGCVVRDCGTTDFNGDHGGALGVHIDNGTLENSLVTGCRWSGDYRDGKKFESAVTLRKGVVNGCVISNNTVSAYALSVADSAYCCVSNTVVRDNVSLRGVGANIPNANEIGPNAVVSGLELGTVAKLPAGTYEVDNAVDLENLLSQEMEDGVVIRIAAGEYVLQKFCYPIRAAVKLLGAGRDRTVLKKSGQSSAGRFFYVNHADALIANLTLKGSASGASGGGLWIDGRGGTVSNCAVRACRTGAAQAGGGVYLSSANARITGSEIGGNVVGQNTHGGGVLLAAGLLDSCLIVSNTMQYADRVTAYGAGVCLNTSTEDARVVNCTIVANRGYEGALYRKAGAGYVVNTISADNIAAGGSGDADFISLNSATRSTDDCVSSCCSSADIGTDCTVGEPCFRNPSVGDYSLAASSPCIGAGVFEDWMSGSRDFRGRPRVSAGCRVDLGCYQYTRLSGTVYLIR